MTAEQQLVEAFRAAAGYEVSPDLYARVVHSIEEDQRHRARVRGATVAVAVVGALLFAIAVMSLESRPIGAAIRYRIDWRVLEMLEFTALGTMVGALGPAIRRFGRGYVADIFAGPADSGHRLLRLLDVAYHLVFWGYVLVTVRLAAPVAYHLYAAGDQVEQAAARLGGLLLIMGILHAATLVAMPVTGLVYNTTRRGRTLPRWVTVLVVLAAIGAVWIGLMLAAIGGLSG